MQQIYHKKIYQTEILIVKKLCSQKEELEFNCSDLCLTHPYHHIHFFSCVHSLLKQHLAPHIRTLYFYLFLTLFLAFSMSLSLLILFSLSLSLSICLSPSLSLPLPLPLYHSLSLSLLPTLSFFSGGTYLRSHSYGIFTLGSYIRTNL